MTRYLGSILIFVFVGRFCVANLLAGDHVNPQRVEQLLQNSVVPFEQDPNGVQQYTDEFKEHLQDRLRDVRIVALGECTHEDGTTFEQKVRLVKFLHEEMGFNVLAFEYGFLGEWKNNRNISQNPEDLVTAFRYSGWSRSKYAFPMYEYIAESQSSESPLILAGFDGEKVPDGIPNVLAMIKEIVAATGYELDDRVWPDVEIFVKAIYGPLGNAQKKEITQGSRDSANEILHQLAEAMDKMKEPLIDAWGVEKLSVYRLALRSLVLDEKAIFAGAFWNIIRDKNMFERIQWLDEIVYPSEKIIIWAASSHFARNMVHIDRQQAPGSYGFYPYYQAGDWTYSHYGKQFYSIAFVAGSGATGLTFPEGHESKSFEFAQTLDAAEKGSFADIAMQTRCAFLFCDLRAADHRSWLSNEFVARPMGYNNDNTFWKNTFDAFYFVREMQPDLWQDVRNH